MKKSIIIALMFLILLAASCGRQDKEQKTTEEAKDKTIKYKELEPIDLEQDAVTMADFINDEIWDVIYFDSNKVAYFMDTEGEDPDTGTLQVYLYDRKTGKNKHIIEITGFNTSRGDICVFGDKVYYAFWRIMDDGGCNNLLELDLEKEAAQLIPIENSTVPFVDIAATDHNVFILKRSEIDMSTMDYIVEMLDRQGFKEVSKVTSISGESEDGKKGGYYLDFLGEGDNLYLFQGNVRNNNYNFICMTEEGEIKENCEIDLEEDLKLEQEGYTSEDDVEEDLDMPWEILKKGDYYVVGTLNNRNLVFHIKENKIVKISAPEQLGSKDLNYGAKKIKGLGKGKYIYFAEIGNNVIDVFDTQTETFGHMEVKVDGKIRLIRGNKDNQFLFSVRRKDGTYDYMIYERKEI